jgi:hypothetical protein
MESLARQKAELEEINKKDKEDREKQEKRTEVKTQFK